MQTSIFQYWGKSSLSENTEELAYHLLAFHSLDVAAVGDVYLRKNPRLLTFMAAAIGIDQEVLHKLIIFFLALHDLGKFASTFQCQRPDVYQLLTKHNDANRFIGTYDERHDTLGSWIWADAVSDYLESISLQDSLGQAELAMAILIDAMAGHHGVPPKSNERKTLKAFSPKDKIAVKEFIQAVDQIIKPNITAISILSFEQINIIKQYTWWLAGLAVLCDWIGSDKGIFEYDSKPLALSDYWQSALLKASQALDKAQVLPTKVAASRKIEEIFPYIGANSTPLQKFAYDKQLPAGPQLWILEDVTGAGKTEAAMILAHRLMAQGLAQGIFVALPTMATTNAMYQRVARSYLNIFDDENKKPSIILAHGKRELVTQFTQSIIPHDTEDDGYKRDNKSASAQCAEWLANHRKKALLADVGVGTIDQAILGILPSRHQSLRLFGLANKVLIVDEVHAYDAYTNQLLLRLLEFHAAIGGSAILLSATLPKAIRQKFADVYMKASNANSAKLENNSYPLATCIASDNNIIEKSLDTRTEVIRSVEVKFLHQEENVIAKIMASVQEGHCICWVRNTIEDARRAYQELQHQLPSGQVLLFHSRYALCDRLEHENHILDLFGLSGEPKNRAGRILIGTQVIEQSLDIDLDIMFSDLAPMDLLIQRAGRLQRHKRNAEGRVTIKRDDFMSRIPPILWVLAPEWDDEPQVDWYSQLFPKAKFVYPDAGALWLTQKILRQIGRIRMPDDARILIDSVYGEGLVIPETLQKASNEKCGKDFANRDQASFIGLSLAGGYDRNGSEWCSEAKVSTRLGQESHEIYLAKVVNGELLPWANTEDYRWDNSIVRIDSRKLKDICEYRNESMLSKLKELKQTTKALCKELIVLPLTEVNEGEWEGYGLDDNNGEVVVKYSKESGLVVKGNK